MIKTEVINLNLIIDILRVRANARTLTNIDLTPVDQM